MMPYQFRTKANIIDSQDFQSSVITSLRFPLIVMIIMFHLYEPGAVIDDSSMLHYSLAKILGADGIAKIAVPTFFMISGYLFFFNIKKWDILEYRRKLKSRVSSLLIPYLLWNAIPIIGGILLNIFIAIAHGMPLFAQAKEFLHSIGWLNAFWNVSDGHPYVVPLWYIRDLMICCLFTPLIYFFIDSKIGCFYLLIIGICFLTDFGLMFRGLVYGLFSSFPSEHILVLKS